MKVGSVHGIGNARTKRCLTAVLLVAVTMTVYAPVRDFRFLNFDDNEYVTDNSQVKLGLTWKGFVWAFTATQASNWHPLTWLSHMVDVSLWGMNPGGHHLTNVFFHAANTALLFLLLRIMTTALWPSALVAALFALHPLHVESVAWVAERKDVLSTFFGLLAILAYVRYAERPDVRRYLPVLLLFALSLLAKPMLVTLPFLLLLLDYWPLVRLDGIRPRNNRNGPPRYRPGLLVDLLLEKAPLLALSAASSVITIFAQSHGGSLAPFDRYPLSLRVGNAVISYLGYLGNTIWPSQLAPLYPLSLADQSRWKIAASVLILSTITLAALKSVRRYPNFAVGWLWYLGTLIPVIGLVQVGEQSMADRYTYVPILGIFVMGAWGLREMVAQWPRSRAVLSAVACLALAILAIITSIQLTYWHDSVVLFEHTLRVTRNNYLAHNNLGAALEAAGKEAEAASHYQEAFRINPRDAWARTNLANALMRQGKLNEALALYEWTGRRHIDFPELHNNRGAVLFALGRYQEATGEYRKALTMKPDYTQAYINLARALAKQDRLAEAVEGYQQALRLDPTDVAIHFNLAGLLSKARNVDEAIREYRAALQLKPDYLEARNNLGALLGEQGKADEAIAEYREGLRTQPDSAELHYNLGIELSHQGKADEAIYHFRQALKINPGYTDARIWLGKALTEAGRRPGP